MYITKFLLLAISIHNSKAQNCTQENFYISTESNLEQLENCTNINGNLIINSGYNINSFDPLTNLQSISGYLLIFDNHNISSMEGFHNLVHVYGQDLYLDTYSVVIKYNINEANDTHNGLCYVDTVNWTNITDFPIDIRHNGINCSDCHIECNGCWGNGSVLCQECQNYESHGICIPESSTSTTLTSTTSTATTTTTSTTFTTTTTTTFSLSFVKEEKDNVKEALKWNHYYFIPIIIVLVLILGFLVHKKNKKRVVINPV